MKVDLYHSETADKSWAEVQRAKAAAGARAGEAKAVFQIEKYVACDRSNGAVFDYNWSVDEGEKPASLFVFADSKKVGTVDTKNVVMFQDGEKMTTPIEFAQILNRLDREEAARVVKAFVETYKGVEFQCRVPLRGDIKRWVEAFVPGNGN